MNFTIRRILESDVEFLWETLYESMFVPEGEQPFTRDIIDEPYVSKYVEGWGRNGDDGFIAMNEHGEPIGSITVRYFSKDNQGFGYVDDDVPELGMAVLKAYRGQGIGKALMDSLFHALKDQGVERVSLSVDPRNIPAVGLYEHYGFIPVGRVGTSITMIAHVTDGSTKSTNHGYGF